jgi:hypothetical protein
LFAPRASLPLLILCSFSAVHAILIQVDSELSARPFVLGRCRRSLAAQRRATRNAQPNHTQRARTDALLILCLAMSLNAAHLAPDIAAAARTSSGGLLVLLAIAYYDLSAQITRTHAAPLLLSLCAHRFRCPPLHAVLCFSVLLRVTYALFAAVRALQTRRLKDAHALAIYGQHNKRKAGASRARESTC